MTSDKVELNQVKSELMKQVEKQTKELSNASSEIVKLEAALFNTKNQVERLEKKKDLRKTTEVITSVRTTISVSVFKNTLMEVSPNEIDKLRPVTEKFDNLEISKIKTSLTSQTNVFSKEIQENSRKESSKDKVDRPLPQTKKFEVKLKRLPKKLLLKHQWLDPSFPNLKIIKSFKIPKMQGKYIYDSFFIPFSLV